MKRINAGVLRYILFVGLILLLSAGVVLFGYSYSLLAGYTHETSILNAQAQASDTNLLNLKKLKAYLSDNSKEIQRVHDVVAESKQYQYQNDIVEDISKYAQETGVSITTFNFISTGSAPTPTAAAGTATSGAQTQAIKGVRSMTADITLRNPVEYTTLLRFIKRIESSPMKMQIGNIGLTRDRTVKSAILTDVFTIEVYVR